jgi:hypothetical protein
MINAKHAYHAISLVDPSDDPVLAAPGTAEPF